MLDSLLLHERLLGLEKPFLELSKWIRSEEGSFSLAVLKGPYGGGKTLLLDILENSTQKHLFRLSADLKISNCKSFIDILLTLKGTVDNRKGIIFVLEDIDVREDYQEIIDIFEQSCEKLKNFLFLSTASEDFMIPRWSKLFDYTNVISLGSRSVIHSRAIIEKILGCSLNTKERFLISQSCETEQSDLRFLTNNIKFFYHTGSIKTVFSKDLTSLDNNGIQSLDTSSLKLHSNLPKLYESFSQAQLAESDNLIEIAKATMKKLCPHEQPNGRSKHIKQEAIYVPLKKNYRELRPHVRLEISTTLERMLEEKQSSKDSSLLMKFYDYFEERYLLGKLGSIGINTSATGLSPSLAQKTSSQPNIKRRKMMGNSFGYKYNEGTSVAVRKRVNYRFFEYIAYSKDI